MGNCSLKGVTGDCHNSIKILTDSGAILQFRGPITAREILNEHPGYGIFRQDQASSSVRDLERLTGGRSYYLLPVVKKEENVLCSSEDTEQVQNRRAIEELEAEWLNVTELAKKSLGAASNAVEDLANGSAMEVLPSARDGVWRVKLVIDTKQWEEILSEQVNTEALIERMRMAASSASLTPKRTKVAAWGMGLKPTFSNLFKMPS
ncbi:hypothetical protein I3843_12G080700 [Carya illinoinensis]|uniref:Uncharacterized protein n=1 Tax=Carya illinoinensis TaxID=32201 RepID=A0A8T1NUS3_CARIL|nr:hypothetical protein I3760_12G078600 [Carya illinoinensis]KAG6633908.1 hypothetical protein CIPAW_12G081200 [Carya illinoinensis]KAG7952867.1 hypothetical protein I3843_12G080700 [Carya illinoinensis]